jgi:hypothetical protein
MEYWSGGAMVISALHHSNTPRRSVWRLERRF